MRYSIKDVPLIAKQRIIELAKAAGFELCGVAAALPLEEGVARYRHWLAAGQHAGMDWMARNIELRCDPRLLFPPARSILMIAPLFPARR